MYGELGRDVDIIYDKVDINWKNRERGANTCPRQKDTHPECYAYVTIRANPLTRKKRCDKLQSVIGAMPSERRPGAKNRYCRLMAGLGIPNHQALIHITAPTRGTILRRSFK